MLEKEMLDKLDLEVVKIFYQVKCKKCNRTWGINLYSIDDTVTMNYGVCIKCAAEEYIKNK